MVTSSSHLSQGSPPISSAASTFSRRL
ncbi:hypothetical protein NC651_017252 [Populus alba x Populus x berolinensis]|nr:hypothetical protein NC651_017252 [Populus alba x Populus x berolinensis]